MNEYLAALVDELYTLGMREVVFSAGSRSTSLAMLFTNYKQFNTYMAVDERSAGFFALGIAKRTGRPVGLVCTSGSAGTHYYPAVVEAKASRTPLVIMTADRPMEKQFVGAPQTIDQTRLFGEFVNHFEQLVPSPDDYEYPRAVAQRSMVQAQSHGRHGAGPVQINVPLREPLVPDLDPVHFEKGRSAHPFEYVRGEMASTYTGAELMGKCGIILAGPYNNPQGDEEATKAHYDAYINSVMELAHLLKAPVLADPLSLVRRSDDSYIIDSYDAFLSNSDVRKRLKPDYILLLGQLPVSKRVHQLLTEGKDALVIQVDPNIDYRNGMVTTNKVIETSVIQFVKTIKAYRGNEVFADSNIERTGSALPKGEVQRDGNIQDDALKLTDYVNDWLREQEFMRKALNEVKNEPSLFEGRIVHELQHIMPAGAQVVVANSMAIRDFDYFWAHGKKDITLFGNRGVNGIDGTESTALGIAAGGAPTVLVTGDLSFIHDMNGLLLGRQAGISLTIVLFNNDGGGIFEYLPQKGTPYFDYLFATPQGATFEGAAQLYGVDHEVITSYDRFNEAISESLGQEGIQILEIKTGRETSCALHRKYTVRNYE